MRRSSVVRRVNKRISGGSTEGVDRGLIGILGSRGDRESDSRDTAEKKMKVDEDRCVVNQISMVDKQGVTAGAVVANNLMRSRTRKTVARRYKGSIARHNRGKLISIH
jgi:hypothetical protein